MSCARELAAIDKHTTISLVFFLEAATFLFLPLCKYYSLYNWGIICNSKTDYLASACVDMLLELVLLKN